MRLTRYYMYNNIQHNLKTPLTGKILDISGTGTLDPMIDVQNSDITQTTYPDVDMQSMLFEDGCFDVVISDQVIEHLEDPQRAVDESYRVLKKGGIAIHTSCFINSIHEPAPDYWRFSQDGLRYLCRAFSRIVVCEGWGNRIAIIICLYLRKLRFLRIGKRRFSLLRKIAEYNEPEFPISTWIVAEK